MTLTNPPALKPGDTIAIVSPSAGLAELFPHRYEKGISMLEEMGYKTATMPHARERSGWVSASPRERAADLQAAFEDPSIHCIMAAIGGNHANQILKYLDFDAIATNPKIFVGYSDNTILHYALASRAHLRTFYGPCLISEFGEHPEVLAYTRSHFEHAVCSRQAEGPIAPSDTWTDEFLDWFEKADQKRPRTLLPHDGYEWWRTGQATGPIWGGAVPTMTYLAGTDYWVDPTGTIFFLDIPEGDTPGKGLSQSWLDAFLGNLDNLGVFHTIAGLIIGRPYGYKEEETEQLKEMIMRYTESTNYPILYNANIGHTAPILTVPLGVPAELDSATNIFALLESGVQ